MMYPKVTLKEKIFILNSLANFVNDNWSKKNIGGPLNYFSESFVFIPLEWTEIPIYSLEVFMNPRWKQKSVIWKMWIYAPKLN